MPITTALIITEADKLGLPASKDEQFQPNPKELDLAKRLVGDMSEKWNPSKFHDEKQAALMAFIDEKISKGATEVVKGGERESDSSVTASNTIDLAAYLEKSIMAGKNSKGTKDPGPIKSGQKDASRKQVKKVPKKSA